MTGSTRTALIVGSTGLVGSHLLGQLLDEAAYDRVIAIGRRAVGAEPRPRLVEKLVDFERLSETAGDWEAQDLFLCLGTTMAVAGSREAFRRVDHDYTLETARLARERGARRFGLVSSIGAAAGARSFYLRVKGETERDLETLGYESMHIFRPSLLLGERAERRRGEAAGGATARAMSWAMVGALRKYRPIPAERVAAAMLAAVLSGEPGRHLYTHGQILALAAKPEPKGAREP
ncbi:MAG: NAD-dependent epimerase/dehydratase family protein [Polyangia bacterium]|jgi:uncharacterized protein YbjT (DUF2867 family)|nr:NAD-dependent epimerase/dehydratase family protein [Polyangia bacterium]